MRRARPCSVGALTAFYPSSRPSEGRAEDGGRISEAFRFLFVPKEKVAAPPPLKLRPTSSSSRPPISQAMSSLKEYTTSRRVVRLLFSIHFWGFGAFLRLASRLIIPIPLHPSFLPSLSLRRSIVAIRHGSPANFC